MDLANTLLVSSDADSFFGSSEYACNNTTLEATLRYIAIKDNGGDIEKAKLIKTVLRCANYDDRSGNVYAREGYDVAELLIITPYQRGNDLLSIDAEGWVSLDSPPYPVAALISSKSSETRIYVNTSKKRAVLFVRTVTNNWCELVAQCLFRILPWRFRNDETELNLMKAISKQDSETFKSIVNACCANFDFKSSMIKRNLIGWTSSFKKAQIDKLERQMSSLMDNIRNLETQIAGKMDEYGAANDNLLALQRLLDENDDTLFKFFTNHQQLDVYRVYSSCGNKILEYSVVETIEYYDEDNFLNNYNNPGSAIGNSGADMERILYGIFKEHKGVIRAEAIFRLTNLSSLTVVSDTRTGKFGGTHLAHPHLVRHGCLGANRNYINKYMMSGDWDMAIEQSIAAVKNLNMGDAVVISSMVRDLENSMDCCTCIIADNDKAMTPRQFLNYLRETDNNEGTTNG